MRGVDYFKDTFLWFVLGRQSDRKGVIRCVGNYTMDNLTEISLQAVPPLCCFLLSQRLILSVSETGTEKGTRNIHRADIKLHCSDI